MTTREAAERLGVTPKTIREYCRQGRLVGGQRVPFGPWNVDPKSVDQLVRQSLPYDLPTAA